MDQFVTTYRKDYLWPYVRTIGTKPVPDSFRTGGMGSGGGVGGGAAPGCMETTPGTHGDMCPCHCANQAITEQLGSQLLGPNAHSQDTWSRLAPTGPLLDPKLYPARVGTAPENDSMRFNQPNVFLDKLSQKYPFLYEVLRTAPPDDIISRINRDRLRSTYQVDYCNMNEYPSAPYDELLRAAGMQGAAPCSEPVRLPGDPCRPNQKPIAFRLATMSKQGKGDAFGNSLRGGDCGKGIEAWNPFIKNGIEVDDNTKRWGQMIYRDSSHGHSSVSVPRSYIRKVI